MVRLLVACSAAAVLTAVLARAEFFTLAVAGYMLEVSDGRSSPTSRSPATSQQLEAAAERSTTVVAGGGLLVGATVGAGSCCR